MAKEQAVATISPSQMVLGAPVFAEHGRMTIKNANWVFGNRPQTHINQSTGKRLTTAQDTPPSSLDIFFRSTIAGSVTVLLFSINVLPETVNLVCGAECYMVGGTGDVTFNIGAASGTMSFSEAAGDSDVEKTLTLATSATGRGWLTCSIEIEKTAGADDINLSRFRVQDEPITSSLPSPTIEGDNDTMDVQEEGTAVVLSARKLNFLGGDVTASSAGSGIANITVSSLEVVRKTADDTPVSAQVSTMYLVSTADNDVEIDLPPAAGNDGKTIDVMHEITGNDCIIDPFGAEEINGSTASVTLTGTAYENKSLVCDGVGWFIR